MRRGGSARRQCETTKSKSKPIEKMLDLVAVGLAGLSREERKARLAAGQAVLDSRRPKTKRKPMPRPATASRRDVEILEESALAAAQSTIQAAMNRHGMTKSKLADAMGRPRSFVSRMMSGGHNLTVKILARALAACDAELEFRAATSKCPEGTRLVVTAEIVLPEEK